MSAILAIVTAVTGAEIGYLFIAAGLLMIALDAPPRWLRRGGNPALLPLSALAKITPPWLIVTASAGVLASLGLFFLKAGAFIFGSGLAIVLFLRQGVVVQHHWLTSRQFIDAVATELITPGPVVITATFIGYLVAGLPGALLATVAIFIPIYLGVTVPGRWFVRYRAPWQGPTVAKSRPVRGFPRRCRAETGSDNRSRSRSWQRAPLRRALRAVAACAPGPGCFRAWPAQGQRQAEVSSAAGFCIGDGARRKMSGGAGYKVPLVAASLLRITARSRPP